MATDPVVCVERGMSVPAEVVFHTATDPSRASAWLPVHIRAACASPTARHAGLSARWASPNGWAIVLRVEPGTVGGATVRLALTGTASMPRLAALAQETLANLAREVADNLNVG